MSYRIETLDLSAAQDKKVIVERDTEVVAWTVVALPAGAQVQLHIGQNGDPIDINVEGISGEPDVPGCPLTTDGLFYSCLPQPGVSVKLYIGFGQAARITR